MKCRGCSPGSLSASGEVNDRDLPESLDDDLLQGNELLLNIMQEFTPYPFWANVHYVRLLPWRYRDILRGSFTYTGSFRGSLKDTHGRVLKHDSIVVKIDNGKWIKAEKSGVEPEMNIGGIRVYLVRSTESDPEKWKDEVDEQPGRYSVRFTTGGIKLGKGRSDWKVGDLRRLLRSCDDPDYNVVSANCWKYANSSARAVLEWVEENALDEQVQNQVHEKLEELARLERPMPLALCRAFWNTRAEESRAVLAQFRRKLTGTRRALPRNSIFRRWGVRGIRKVLSLHAPCHAAVAAAHHHSVRVRRVLLVMVAVQVLVRTWPLVN